MMVEAGASEVDEETMVRLLAGSCPINHQDSRRDRAVKPKEKKSYKLVTRTQSLLQRFKSFLMAN
jgi:hypothetical protein